MVTYSEVTWISKQIRQQGHSSPGDDGVSHSTQDVEHPRAMGDEHTRSYAELIIKIQ